VAKCALLGTELRVLDPDTGEPIPVPDEQVHLEQQARLAAEQWAHDAEQWAQVEERARVEEQQARYAAEGRAEQEEQARHIAEDRARSAEQRAQAAEAALAALLAQRDAQASLPTTPDQT